MSNPTRPHRLKEIAESMGESPETLVPRIVVEEGSIAAAARRLGVSNNSIRHWLKKLHYTTQTKQVISLEAQS